MCLNDVRCDDHSAVTVWALRSHKVESFSLDFIKMINQCLKLMDLLLKTDLLLVQPHSTDLKLCVDTHRHWKTGELNRLEHSGSLCSSCCHLLLGHLNHIFHCFQTFCRLIKGYYQYSPILWYQVSTNKRLYFVLTCKGFSTVAVAPMIPRLLFF